MKGKKYRVCIALTIAVIMALSGCAHTSDNDDINSNIITDYYYSKEQIAEAGINRVLDFTQFADNLLLTGITYEDRDGFTGVATAKTITFDLGGSLLNEATLSSPADDMFREPRTAAVDGDGNVWLLFDETDEQTFQYQGSTIEVYDSTGGFMESISLGKLSTDMLMNVDLVISGGNIFIRCDELNSPGGGKVYAFDEANALRFEADRISGICRLADGRVIVKRANITGDGASLYGIDTSTMSLGSQYKPELNDVEFGSSYISGNGRFDLLECTPAGIYGISLNPESSSLLAEWSKQGINHRSDLYKYVAAHGDEIFCLEQTTGNTVNLVRLTQTDAPPGNPAEKTVITIAALYDTDMLSYSVAEFNANNPGVEVHIEIYGGSDPLAAFNLDLIAGNIPDIILLSPVMSIDSYTDKGLFADLYEFIDNDNDISRDDYFPSVLGALETDGKLYEVVPSFYLDTVIGKVSDVGTDMGWTWDDFEALMATKPNGTIPLSGVRAPMSRMDFFDAVFMARSSDFLDYNAGECHFDSEDFIKLLETAEHYYPAEGEYEIEPVNFGRGNPLLIWAGIGAFSSYNTTRYEAYFGEEYTYIGFPASDGHSGSYFSFEDRFAISANSEHKDSAWMYLKYLLTDFQYIDASSFESLSILEGFPVKISAFDEISAQAIINDVDGKIDIDGLEYRYPDENDLRKLYNLIENTNSGGLPLVNIYPIVMEEAADYFNGARTAEEAAKGIQSRVSLYLAEMS